VDYYKYLFYMIVPVKLNIFFKDYKQLGRKHSPILKRAKKKQGKLA